MTLSAILIFAFLFTGATSSGILEQLQKLKYVEKPAKSSSTAWCRYCPFLADGIINNVEEVNEPEKKILDYFLLDSLKDENDWFMTKIAPLLKVSDAESVVPNSEDVCSIAYPCSYGDAEIDVIPWRNQTNITCDICISVVEGILKSLIDRFTNKIIDKYCNNSLTTASPSPGKHTPPFQCSPTGMICEVVDAVIPMVEKLVPREICEIITLCHTTAPTKKENVFANMVAEPVGANPFFPIPIPNMCQAIANLGCEFIIDILLKRGLENKTIAFGKLVINKSLSLCVGTQKTYIQKICSDDPVTTDLCDCACTLLGATDENCWNLFTPSTCTQVVTDLVGLMLQNFGKFITEYQTRLCPWLGGVCNDMKNAV